jgi:nucleoid-associated protein
MYIFDIQLQKAKIMALQIHHVIIHELIKEQHKELQESHKRTKVLPSDDANVIKLVNGALTIYGKKMNAAQYGCFKIKKVGDFPKLYDAYCGLDTPDEAVFIEFTNKSMTELEESIGDKKSPASGGYILFVDYENEYGRSFLIAMLKNKPGLRISDNLIPQELDHIDLSKLHQAARINKYKYQEYQAAGVEEKAEITYLSFVSPSNNMSTAGYFIQALGCSKGTASATSTKLVILEVPQFFRDEPTLDRNDARKIKAELLGYLTDCFNDKKSAKLSEIEAIARQYFPSDDPEQADELADKLFQRLNGEKHGVPIEFSVSKAEVGKAKYHKLKSANWTLEANRSSIGINDNAEIKYHNGSLIISKLSPELQNEIEESLRERGLIQ